MPMTAFCRIFPVIIAEMCVNIGSVGFFNATELIYAVYEANKGGFDYLNAVYVQNQSYIYLFMSIYTRMCVSVHTHIQTQINTVNTSILLVDLHFDMLCINHRQNQHF